MSVGMQLLIKLPRSYWPGFRIIIFVKLSSQGSQSDSQYFGGLGTVASGCFKGQVNLSFFNFCKGKYLMGLLPVGFKNSLKFWADKDVSFFPFSKSTAEAIMFSSSRTFPGKG